MRLFFATDFHGSDICFKKFLKSTEFYDVDALFMGGDYTSKSILFCIKSKGLYKAIIGNHTHIFRTWDEYEKFRQDCWDKGVLVKIIKEDEYETVIGDANFKIKLYEETLRDYLKRWSLLASKQFKRKNIPIYYIPGNDEPFLCDEFFTKWPFISLDRKVVQIDNNLGVLGLGGSNATPWKTYREYDENTLYKFIENAINQSNKNLSIIFFIHVPPYNSGLDQAPALNSDLSYKLVLGSPQMQSVGSKSVSRAIKKFDPILGLFGHVHECRRIVRIGKTVCINPGSVYSSGHLQGCIVTIKKRRVEDVQLTEG